MPVDESKANNQDEIKNPVEPDITAAAPLQKPPVSDAGDKDAQTVIPQEPNPTNDRQADKRRFLRLARGGR